MLINCLLFFFLFGYNDKPWLERVKAINQNKIGANMKKKLLLSLTIMCTLFGAASFASNHSVSANEPVYVENVSGESEIVYEEPYYNGTARHSRYDAYAPAAAETCTRSCSNMYVGAFGGANFWSSSHVRTGYLAGMNLGYRLAAHLRVEAEVAYRHNTLKIHAGSSSSSSESSDEVSRSSSSYSGRDKIHFTVHTWSYMANLLYDIDCFSSCVKPYIGGGLGLGEVHARLTSGHHHYGTKKTKFAYQGIAGVKTAVTDCIDAGIQYNYFKVSDIKNNQSVALVLTYAF